MNLLLVKIYSVLRNLVYCFGNVIKVYWVCGGVF